MKTLAHDWVLSGELTDDEVFQRGGTTKWAPSETKGQRGEVNKPQRKEQSDDWSITRNLRLPAGSSASIKNSEKQAFPAKQKAI